LFPVIAGGWGAIVKYNFGHTKMQLQPPQPEFLPLAFAARREARASDNGISSAVDDAKTQLETLGVDRASLLAGFEAVLNRHKVLPAGDFNNDGVYRDALDQVSFAHRIRARLDLVDVARFIS
jgi:hypothetical protein